MQLLVETARSVGAGIERFLLGDAHVKYRQWKREQILAGEVLEEKMHQKYGIGFAAERYTFSKDCSLKPVEAYASSLVALDMLDRCFQEAQVTLPRNPVVLDIGAGYWEYVHAFYAFLQKNSGSQQVYLEGIEFYGNLYKENVEARTRGMEDVTYSPGDFFQMPADSKYDLVLAMHPLATAEVCHNWSIPFRPLEEFWSHALDMVKPGGIIFGCGYLWNEGALAFNSFPTEGRILEMHYYSPASIVRGVSIQGLKGFDENIVMMARKV